MQMKKSITYILVLLLVIACGKKVELPQYTINGKYSDKECTLFIVGLDSRHEGLDSITCDKNGEFTYSIPLDTITPLALVLPDGNSVTLYAEPHRTATLRKDSTMHSGWCVDNGGATQELHDSITRVLDACPTYTNQIAVIDSFIKYNPVNEVCIELIRRYMVNIPNPDNLHIRQRIKELGGIIQDHEFFTSIKSGIDQNNSNLIHKALPTFRYTPNDSTEIKQGDYAKKYLLITFWASWNEASRAELGKLRALDDSIKSKSFAILNISLDHDIAAWRECVEGDSIIGDNVCDTKGWEGDIVKKLNIETLPFSILVTPYQRISKYNISIGETAHLIDSLATKYDEQEETKRRSNTRRNR